MVFMRTRYTIAIYLVVRVDHWRVQDGISQRPVTGPASNLGDTPHEALKRN